MRSKLLRLASEVSIPPTTLETRRVTKAFGADYRSFSSARPQELPIAASRRPTVAHNQLSTEGVASRPVPIDLREPLQRHSGREIPLPPRYLRRVLPVQK